MLSMDPWHPNNGRFPFDGACHESSQPIPLKCAQPGRATHQLPASEYLEGCDNMSLARVRFLQSPIGTAPSSPQHPRPIASFQIVDLNEYVHTQPRQRARSNEIKSCCILMSGLREDPPSSQLRHRILA